MKRGSNRDNYIWSCSPWITLVVGSRSKDSKGLWSSFLLMENRQQKSHAWTLHITNPMILIPMYISRPLHLYSTLDPFHRLRLHPIRNTWLIPHIHRNHYFSLYLWGESNCIGNIFIANVNDKPYQYWFVFAMRLNR